MIIHYEMPTVHCSEICTAKVPKHYDYERIMQGKHVIFSIQCEDGIVLLVYQPGLGVNTRRPGAPE